MRQPIDVRRLRAACALSCRRGRDSACWTPPKRAAAGSDLVTVTGELLAGPRRGNPWVDAEASCWRSCGRATSTCQRLTSAKRGGTRFCGLYTRTTPAERHRHPVSGTPYVIMDVHVKMGLLGRDRLCSVIAASYLWLRMVEDVVRAKKAFRNAIGCTIDPAGQPAARR